jgi:transcriptional antiterminator RfaH
MLRAGRRVRWGLIMAGDAPARVSDAVIAELRGRERDGLIELPKAPGLKPGDHVRIIAGPFSEHLALYEGQTSHERVAVLLQFLGGRHRTELPANAIESKEAAS